MRKIDKTPFWATAFANYIKEYNNKFGHHPVYDSSKNAYYNDIYYNLLFCQRGLCAYTEDLIDDTIWKAVPQNWEKGKYIGKTLKLDADLEHFDPKLKDKQGWDFDNLFLVKIYNNRKIKLGKDVHLFFKPDLPNYNPKKYMEYNFLTHQFVPLNDLSEDLYTKVDYMIDTLGINAHSVISNRRQYLLEIKITLKNEFVAFEIYQNERLYKFFTAFEMSKFDLI